MPRRGREQTAKLTKREDGAREREVYATLSSAIELARRPGYSPGSFITAALTRERLRRANSPDESRELAALYAKLTEGMDTPDPQAARDLLAWYRREMKTT